MKFAVLGEHRHFFKQNQALEVEEVLTANQLKNLNDQIEKVLEIRLKAKPQRAFLELPKKIFTVARDFSRENEILKKLILNKKFAEIATELIENKSLRYGFDQLYLNVPDHFDGDEVNPYKELAQSPVTLQETTCLQDVLCGLMICLEGSEEDVSKEEVQTKELQANQELPNEEQPHDEQLKEKPKTISIFSKKPGSAVFFTPEKLIDYSELISNQTARYLMIVYTHPKSIYYLQENDPQTHALKGLGYVFGDRLNDKLNPIVIR